MSEFARTQKYRFILWLPVFFGAGLLTFYSHGLVMELIYLASIAIGSIITALIALRFIALRWCLLYLACIFLGHIWGHVHWQYHYKPSIKTSSDLLSMHATIESIKQQGKGKKLLLSNIHIIYPNAGLELEYITLTINTPSSHLNVGDRIACMALLKPFPKPYVPGGFDIARYWQIQSVQAQGYSVNIPTIISKSDTIWTHIITRLRKHISDAINMHTLGTANAMIHALLIGDKGKLTPSHKDAFALSGLAHLLAISGLHLALVTTFIFIGLRKLMACSYHLALFFPIKALSALCALLASYVYLQLAGEPISASRAFVMSSLILLAILLHRSPHAMRSLAFGAMALMLISPYSVTLAGFHLSFAATLALIAYAEQKYLPQQYVFHEYRWHHRLWRYIKQVMLTSIIAGLATAPYIMYHFGHVSTLGLFANLFAIPLMCFVIMPIGIIALTLMPLGLATYPLKIMAIACNALYDIAAYTASIPISHINAISLNFQSTSFITIALLWLCLWQGNARKLFIIPLLAGLLCRLIQTHTPDILINQHGNTIAFLTDTHQLAFYPNDASHYLKRKWLYSYHLPEATYPVLTSNPSCDPFGCLYQKHQFTVAISLHPTALHQDCQQAHYIINLSGHHDPLCLGKQLTPYQLWKHGTHAITIEEHGIKTQHP